MAISSATESIFVSMPSPFPSVLSLLFFSCYCSWRILRHSLKRGSCIYCWTLWLLLCKEYVKMFKSALLHSLTCIKPLEAWELEGVSLPGLSNSRYTTLRAKGTYQYLNYSTCKSLPGGLDHMLSFLASPICPQWNLQKLSMRISQRKGYWNFWEVKPYI